MVLYGLGLPLITLFSMRRHQKKPQTHEDGTARDADANASGSIEFDEFGSRLWCSLMKDCKAEYYWWGLSTTWRKLLCAVLIQLGRPSGVEVQAQLVQIVYVVALAAQARFQPYKAPLINSLELLAIANIIITVWLAVLLTVAGDTLKEVLSVLILVVNAVTLLIFFWYIAQQLQKRVPVAGIVEALTDAQTGPTVELSQVRSDPSRTAEHNDSGQPDHDSEPEPEGLASSRRSELGGSRLSSMKNENDHDIITILI